MPTVPISHWNAATRLPSRRVLSPHLDHRLHQPTGEPVKLSKAMRPRSPAFLIPAVKGLICGAIGGLALAYSFTATGPHAGFLPLAMFVYSIPSLFAAIWYLIAAFLLARAQVGWRVFGALLDAAASLVISWALVEEGIALSGRDGPLPISIATAAIWVGALIPVFASLYIRSNEPGKLRAADLK
jgi:hypothetical protein